MALAGWSGMLPMTRKELRPAVAAGRRAGALLLPAARVAVSRCINIIERVFYVAQVLRRSRATARETVAGAISNL
jgi:hypothetical protein